MIAIPAQQSNQVLIDFNDFGSFDQVEDPELSEFYPDNWTAALNTSAGFPDNKNRTFIKRISCKFMNIEDNRAIGDVTDGYVLGVRGSFSTSDYNAHITIRPPHIIPVYGGTNGKLFLNRGMLNNVGPIRDVSIWIKGKLYPHALYVNLRDENGRIRKYFMGYLDFEGWRVMKYQNENFNREWKNHIVRKPDYPRMDSLLIFDSIEIIKDGYFGMDGDFIGYIGWIKVNYMPYRKIRKSDIDDEASWGIKQDMMDQRQAPLKKRIEDYKFLIDQELKKMNRMPESGSPDGP